MTTRRNAGKLPKKQKGNDINRCFKYYLAKFDKEFLDKDNDIIQIIMEHAHTGDYRFHIKEGKSKTNTKSNLKIKSKCEHCGYLRFCDYTLMIEEYIAKTDEEYDDGEESDYETTDPVKIGNHCIKKIIILKKVSNTLYKIKMLEDSRDYKTNKDKQFDVMQLIADVHFLFDELKNLAKTIKEKCISQEAASHTTGIII
jgi:hypothetical protein